MPEVVNTSALVIDQGETEGAEDSRPVMIDVDHVSMSFNMASEQLNSLKEYALALAKGKLFFEEFKALDDVSFQVRKGDVFGIMGTNGSGKSTILKIIAGVLEPTKGKCTVNGNIAPLIELGAGFDMDLSARENIYLNGALLGYSRDFINEHFDEIVEFAEVEKFLDMPLKNYSSGMVSRIAFAIATVIVPEILVVDEVLSVGDFMFQRKCENRITQLIEEYGVTVLIVSHSNDQIARLCNKAIWIEKGHTRLQGDAKMVAHVYGGLGGRTGSKESERIVFEALKSSFLSSRPLGNQAVIGGETPEGVNSNMVLEAFGDDEVSTVVLASSSSHANAIMANALASCMDAPVLPLGVNGLSETIERVLYVLKPSHLIIVDADNNSLDAIEGLSKLPWRPSLRVLGGDKDVFSTSREIFELGLNEGYWQNSVALFDFRSNPESLCAAPFLYGERCPAFVVTEEGQLDDSFLLYLESRGVKRLFCFGCFAAEQVKGLAMKERFEISFFGNESEARCCEEISIFVGSRELGDSVSMVVATASISQWPELLSSGCYAAKAKAPLLLVNEQDLDSVSFCLEYADKRLVEGRAVCFVGGKSGLSDIDKRLFLSCGVGAPSHIALDQI